MMPPDRRQPIREEFEHIRHMSEEDRRTHLASDDFRTRFSPVERRMLTEWASLLAP